MLSVFQALGEGGADVIRVFEADGEADGAVAEADARFFCRIDAAVRGAVRMGDDGAGVTEVAGVAEPVAVVDEVPGRVFAAFYVKADHAAEAAVHLSRGKRVLRVAFEAGVVHAGDSGLCFQPARDMQRVFAVRAHAQGEGFEAFQVEPGFKGAEAGADAAHQLVERGAVFFGFADDDAAQRPPLAVKVFGGRMHAVVRAEFKRALQDGGGEAVIDRQFGAAGVGDVGNGGDVADGKQRVGRAFKEEQAGIRPHCRTPVVKVGEFDQRGFDAEFGQGFAKEVQDGAEAVARADDVVARLQCGEGERQNGAHAG